MTTTRPRRRLRWLVLVLCLCSAALGVVVGVKAYVQRCIPESRTINQWTITLLTGRPWERDCAARVIADASTGNDILARLLINALTSTWDRKCIRPWQPAHDALCSMGPRVIPALEWTIDQGDPWLCKFAIRILGQVGTPEHGTLAFLQERLRLSEGADPARRARAWAFGGYHIRADLRAAIRRVSAR